MDCRARRRARNDMYWGIGSAIELIYTSAVLRQTFEPFAVFARHVIERISEIGE